VELGFGGVALEQAGGVRRFLPEEVRHVR